MTDVIDVLKSTTMQLVDFFGEAPDWSVPILVGSVYAIGMCLILSAPTSIARWRQFGVSYRLRYKVERRYNQNSRCNYRPLVNRAVAEMRLLQRMERLGEFFGGELVAWSPRFIYIHPREVLRFPVLAISFAVIYLTWPDGGLSESFRTVGIWLASLETWEPVRSLLPILLVAVAILLAMPKQPIIDRVRARDEAAKDANRLLTEFSAQLSDLYSASSEWGEYMATQVDTLVSARLSEVSDGHLEMVGGVVQEKPLSTRLDGHQSERRSKLADSLLASLTAAHLTLDVIRSRGLAYVATRMTDSLRPFLLHAELDWHRRNHDYGVHYLTPGSVAKMQSNRIRNDAFCTDLGLDSTAPESVENYRRQRLGEDANGLATMLLVSSVQVQFRAECIRLACHVLVRRSLGTTWTRLAGVTSR